ncbi:hypothetical protein SSP531S_12650 [Streptomyces spongiicola]|uniref:Uncharacterized protein n=1 Tax=Streptomyces spongiicola TaxID=1690221 RepID=A0A388SUT3_9ACTN|nr:hypothetical protein SSP531S_12650 [Streptomyces spongiicola]
MDAGDGYGHHVIIKGCADSGRSWACCGSPPRPRADGATLATRPKAPGGSPLEAEPAVSSRARRALLAGVGREPGVSAVRASAGLARASPADSPRRADAGGRTPAVVV